MIIVNENSILRRNLCDHNRIIDKSYNTYYISEGYRSKLAQNSAPDDYESS